MAGSAVLKSIANASVVTNPKEPSIINSAGAVRTQGRTVLMSSTTRPSAAPVGNLIQGDSAPK